MKLFNSDYRKIVLEEKVDFILCDIPYNIGKNAYASNPQWWKNGNVKEGPSEKAESMFFESDNEFDLDEFLLYCYINLKEDGKVLLFCSIQQLSYIILNFKKYYFTNYTPLIFRKNNSSEVLKCNMRIVGCCEYGVVLYKGKLGIFNNENKMIKNCFDFVNPKHKKHPNEKPIELLEQFIKLYTNENDVVFDMCMGSGTTGIAAKNLNREFIGIEIDENYFNIAKERIDKENL